MPYNPDTDQTVAIGKNYKNAARTVASLRGQTMRGMLEQLIAKEAKKEKVIISK